MGPVVEAVQRIDFSRRDSEVEQARDGDDCEQTEEHRAEEEYEGEDQGVTVEGPAGESQRVWPQERSEVGDLEEEDRDAAD
jgi:hypothetical protein